MKRPLFVMGLCAALSTAAALLFGDNFAAAVGVFLLLCAGAAPLLLRSRRSEAAAVLLCCAVAMGNALVQNLAFVRPVTSLAGKCFYLEGRVEEIRTGTSSAAYLLDARIPLQDGGTLDARVTILSHTPLPASLNEELCGYAALSASGLEGRYQYANLSDRVLLMGVFEDGVEIRPAARRTAGYRLTEYREGIRRRARSLLPAGDAALLTALLLGDKSGLGEDVTLDFRRAGLSHLMAVSGFHLTLVTALFAGLLRALGAGKRLSALLSLAVVAAFAALAGFTPSVLRAGLMMGLCLVGACIGQRADPLSSLGFAALLLCLWNPYHVLDAGFLLSFSATAGILLLARPLAARLGRVLPGRLAVQALAVSLGAYVMTLPVMMLLFDTFSLTAPLASVAATPLATLLLWCALPALALSGVPFLAPAAWPLLSLVSLLARSLRAVAHAFSELPVALLPIRYDFVKLLAVVFYLGGIALFAVKAPARMKRLCAALGAAVFAAGWATAAVADRDVVRVVTFEGVDAALVTRGSRASLIGFPASSSGGRTIETYCRDWGITSLELALSTSADNDKALGAVALFGRLPPERLMAPGTGEYTRQLVYLARNAKRAAPPEQEYTLETLGAVLTIYPCSCGRACKIEVGGASLLKCNQNCVIIKTDGTTQGVVRGWRLERTRDGGDMKTRSDGDGTTACLFRTKPQGD